MATLATETSLLTRARSVACKYCASLDVVRYGRTPAKKQRYHCRACGRTFLDNGAPPGMRFEAEVIATTLNSFYEGASLGHARRYLQLEYGVRPDHSSIHRWMTRYTKLAAVCVGDPVPLVGREWVALRSEPPSNLARGRATAILDVVDLTTGFLLGTGLIFGPTGDAPSQLLKAAARKATRWPISVLANSLDFRPLPGEQAVPPYERWGFDPSRVCIESPLREVNRVRAWLRDRAEVLSELASPRTARLVLTGWAIHYNYFRSHHGLDGGTPATAAGIDVPVSSWADVVAHGAKTRSIDPEDE